MKISVKGLIFDYGGTLDTNGVHWGEVIWQTYRVFNVPIPLDRFREAYIHVERTLGSQPVIQPDYTFKQTLALKLKLQFEALGLSDWLLVSKMAASCYQKTVYHVRRAIYVLDALKKRYQMALVSNFYGNLRVVVHEFGLTDYFLFVIESASVGIRKPDPAIFQLGIDALGLPPYEVAIIGDSYKNDIAPAIHLGCPAIWLKVKSWNDKDDLISHPFIIHDIEECYSLFLV